MPLSVVDELAAACHLTAEEYGALVLLRLHQWQHGPLPDRDDRLCRIAHVSPDRWPAVRSAIRGEFGENWAHEATSRARRESEATHQRRSDAGRRGGRPPKRHKPDRVPDESRANTSALVTLKAGALREESPALASGKASEQDTIRAIPDPERALAWLKEQGVFPGDWDELQRLLMAGQLTTAILTPSIPK